MTDHQQTVREKAIEDIEFAEKHGYGNSYFAEKLERTRQDLEWYNIMIPKTVWVWNDFPLGGAPVFDRYEDMLEWFENENDDDEHTFANADIEEIIMLGFDYGNLEVEDC